MKHAASLICLWLLLANPAMAGTLTLLSGEQIPFNSEKEFVAILLEEFLPSDFAGETGFFLLFDPSEDKARLHTLLVNTEEVNFTETGDNETTIYLSIEELLQSEEYTEMGERSDYDNVFAIEIALKDLDMVYVYRLPSPVKVRGGAPAKESVIIIDATGEGGFEIIEE